MSDLGAETPGTCPLIGMCASQGSWVIHQWPRPSRTSTEHEDRLARGRVLLRGDPSATGLLVPRSTSVAARVSTDELNRTGTALTPRPAKSAAVPLPRGPRCADGPPPGIPGRGSCPRTPAG